MTRQLRLYLRIFWRILIFALGIVISYAIVEQGFPYLDRYLPAWIVVFVFYLVISYLIIPTLIRLWRLVIKPNHIPIYTTSPDGWAVDPVNIALITRSRNDLIDSFEAAGWIMTDRSTLRNLIHEAYAIVFKKTYPSAPMSKLMLFNRPQDIAFQIQYGDSPSPRHRHHVRLWRLDIPEEDKHYDFWHEIMYFFKRHRSEIWLGAATHDVSMFAIRRRNLQITHKIESDTNKERDFLIQTFRKARRLKGPVVDVASGHELSFPGQTFGVHIIVDGTLKVIQLKK